MSFISTNKKKVFNLKIFKNILIFNKLVIIISIQNYQNFFKMITSIEIKRLSMQNRLNQVIGVSTSLLGATGSLCVSVCEGRGNIGILVPLMQLPFHSVHR